MIATNSLSLPIRSRFDLKATKFNASYRDQNLWRSQIVIFMRFIFRIQIHLSDRLIVHFPISSFVRKVFKFIPIMSSDQNKQEMHNHFPVTWIQYRRSQYYRSTSLYKYVVVKLFQRHFKSRRNERQETPSRWNRFENTESFPEILYKRKCIGSRSWTEFTFSLVLQN